MALGPGTSALTPTMIDPPRLRAREATVRRQFNTRAARFVQHDALVREVGRRLIERFDVIRFTPKQILDVGSGADGARGTLLERFAESEWIGVDSSLAMLRAAPARPWYRRWRDAAAGRRITHVCADALHLPLADASVDLVFSNLMLHWHPQPHTVFPEWRRVLATDGLLLFSCFGPDTLAELRAACERALPHAAPMPFVDMHDFGDMMVAAGFANPVMDVERLTLTYASASELLHEVRALGGNPRDDRAPHLVGTRSARALHAALDAQRGTDGRIALTFEIAYGHAWKPQPKTPGAAGISLDDLRARLPSRRSG
jgi:malonyl-CoA O-methyltransferase